MIHCRMLDATAQLQQEALGILGVNLVHGALTKAGQHYQILAGLMDDLGRSRIEVPSMNTYSPCAACRDGLTFCCDYTQHVFALYSIGLLNDCKELSCIEQGSICSAARLCCQLLLHFLHQTQQSAVDTFLHLVQPERNTC